MENVIKASQIQYQIYVFIVLIRFTIYVTGKSKVENKTLNTKRRQW